VQFMAFPSNPTWFELGGNAAVVGNQGSFTTSLVPPLRYYRVVAVN
jgi:hypothetical protein